MVASKQEEDEEPSDEEDEAPVPEQARFGIEDALAEFELAQAKEATEQQAILDSIQSKTEVEANRRFHHEADMELEDSFTPEDYDEETTPFRPAANDHEASGSSTNVIDISDDE